MIKLVQGGALQGPLFASLIEKLSLAPRELAPGDLIGPYRIVAPIGRGGMAIVYSAERADGEFEQTVALKVIAPDRESRTARELMRRERQILAALNHPHIAKLLDGGSTDNGLLWFAMEPVSGTRIDTFCRERGLSVEQRARLFLQVASAVQFAHVRLVVHRDLKPANILVTEEGQVKLLDFGIAVVAAGDDQPQPLALTPGFASPEQRRGEAITTASDIWQLGNLLALLIGHDVKSRPRRHAGLSAVIDRAMMTEPARRYESAGELAAELDRWLRGFPVAAREGGFFYRASCFFSRHRWSSTAAALISAGVVVLVLQFTLRLARERDAVRREAERANAATELIVEVFRSGDPNVSRGRAIDVRELLDRGVERVRGDLGGQPRLRAHLLQTIGRIQVALGEPRAARPLFDEAVLALRAEAEVEPKALAVALFDQGTATQAMGEPRAALEMFRASVALVAGDSPEERELRRRIFNVMSMAQIGSGSVEAAAETQRQAIALARKEHGPRSAELAESTQNLAIVLRASGRPEEAAAAFAEAWRIYEELHGAGDPRAVEAKRLHAVELLALNRAGEARPLLEQAVESYRRVYHGRGIPYANSLRSLGKLHEAAQDLRGALEYYHRAEEVYAGAVDVESITMAWLLADIAEAYELSEDYPAALRYHEKTLAIRRRLLAGDHFTIAQSLDGCSRQLSRLGRAAEAELSSRESLSIRTSRLPADSPDLARSMMPLGAAQWMLGDFEEAQETWARALDLIARGEGRDSELYRSMESYARACAEGRGLTAPKK